jgi:putative ABC transport system permease protein
MKYSLIDPTLFDMLLVGILFFLILILSVRERVNLEKQLIIGSLRTIFQLIMIGYIIEYIFHLNRWYIVLLALSFMVLVATQTATARQKKKIKGLFGLMGFSIF